MYDALKFSSNIIEKMNAIGYRLDHIKLQKLLYFFSVEYFKRNQKLPFMQKIEKWKLGPVVREVYREYKINGSSAITKPTTGLKFEEGRFTIQAIENEELRPEDDEILDFIIDQYGNRDSFELVELTHQEEAWRRAEPDIQRRATDLFYTIDDFREIAGVV